MIQRLTNSVTYSLITRRAEYHGLARGHLWSCFFPRLRHGCGWQHRRLRAEPRNPRAPSMSPDHTHGHCKAPQTPWQSPSTDASRRGPRLRPDREPEVATSLRSSQRTRYKVYAALCARGLLESPAASTGPEFRPQGSDMPDSHANGCAVFCHVPRQDRSLGACRLLLGACSQPMKSKTLGRFRLRTVKASCREIMAVNGTCRYSRCKGDGPNGR